MTPIPAIPFEDFLLVTRALKDATDRHEPQRRKNAKQSPYINHPITLFQILVEIGKVTDAVALAAALLHDTIEDTGATEAELAEKFGADVAAVVVEVSDDKSLPKPERKRLQIEHAAHSSFRAKLVKLADKIANLRDMVTDPPAYWPLERQQAYFDWAAAVLEGLRGTNEALEQAFEEALTHRPVSVAA
jgi:guanosine-3',5'-bis(diphosphate) 3'-pyrophosphohydrolase